MNFFNLRAPKLIPYAYVKLTDSLLKTWYTRSINHCSQLSTTGLSDHGSHSKSKWFLLVLWGDGVIIVPECSWFSFICIKDIFCPHTFILMCMHLLKEEEKPTYFHNHNLSLSNRLPFNFLCRQYIRQASKHDAQSLGLMLHHLILIYWAPKS